MNKDFAYQLKQMFIDGRIHITAYPQGRPDQHLSPRVTVRVDGDYVYDSRSFKAGETGGGLTRSEIVRDGRAR